MRSRGHLARQVENRNTLLVAGLALADVDRAVLHGLASDGHANRTADQVGICKFLARTLVSVVQEHVETCGLERRSRLGGLKLEARKRNDVRVVGRDGKGPDDPLLV